MDLEELLAAYFDRSLDADGARRLEALLEKDSAAAERFRRMLAIDGLLSARGRDDEEWRRLEANILGSLRAGAEDRGVARKVMTSLAALPPKPWVRRRAVWLAAAGLLVAAWIVLFLFRAAPKPPAEEPPTVRTAPPAPVPPPPPEPLPAPKPAPPEPKPAPPEPKPVPPPSPPKVDVPAPPPQEPPPPAPPEPKPVPPAPPPRQTAVAVARVEELLGETYRVGARRVPIKAGEDLLQGEGVDLAGPIGRVALRFGDGTALWLGGDTSVADVQEKRLTVSRGTVTADVAKQMIGAPRVLATPQGEVSVLGTSFLLAVSDGQTRVEVDEGRVRLTRADGKSVDVTDGYYAVMAKGVELAVRPLQAPPKGPAAHPGVDAKKTDAAIDKGVQWLSTRTYGKSDRPDHPMPDLLVYDELALYTLLHAGVSPRTPLFQQLLQAMLNSELKLTYRVSLQAMILSELEPAKYQERIAQCGQFLVDNQGEKGNWAYGAPTVYPRNAKGVATGGGGKPGAKPKTKILIKAQRSGATGGDCSNSQYAALGLRACMEANVWPPAETLWRAVKHWESIEAPDGSWHYIVSQHVGYGSMTTGGLSSLIIYKHYLKENWVVDPAVVKAADWLGANFSVEEDPMKVPNKNPDPRAKTGALYYYLYGLERAGVLACRAKFGTRDWYREGANFLLAQQKPEGNWDNPCQVEHNAPLADTCFAILFLRRATPALIPVASVDRVLRLK